MKFHKLLVNTLTGCLLVGASGVAMAVNTCGSGAIVNQFIEDNVRTNQSCIIKDSVIMGNVIVDFTGGAGASGVLIMDRNQVFGRVVVTGGSWVITGNLVVAANLKVNDASFDSMVQGNRIKGPNGNIVVSGSKGLVEGFVLIDNNTVSDGDIRCKDDYEAIVGDVDALATNNLVPRGNITCFGQ